MRLRLRGGSSERPLNAAVVRSTVSKGFKRCQEPGAGRHPMRRYSPSPTPRPAARGPRTSRAGRPPRSPARPRRCWAPRRAHPRADRRRCRGRLRRSGVDGSPSPFADGSFQVHPGDPSNASPDFDAQSRVPPSPPGRGLRELTAASRSARTEPPRVSTGRRPVRDLDRRGSRTRHRTAAVSIDVRGCLPTALRVCVCATPVGSREHRASAARTSAEPPHRRCQQRLRSGPRSRPLPGP